MKKKYSFGLLLVGLDSDILLLYIDGHYFL